MSRPYHVLRHRDFRLLWAAQVLSLTGTWMQSAAAHWHIYLLTGSPIALGALGLSRVLPIIVFSLISGVVADAWDRRKLMLFTQTAAALVSSDIGRPTVAAHSPPLPPPALEGHETDSTAAAPSVMK